MKENRDELFLQHILEAATYIESFTTGKTYDQFVADAMMRSAVVHQLLVMGEAANKMSEKTKKLHSEIPWRKMIAMRNKLIHDYFDTDPAVVWKTISEDIPELKKIISDIGIT